MPVIPLASSFQPWLLNIVLCSFLKMHAGFHPSMCGGPACCEQGRAPSGQQPLLWEHGQRDGDALGSLPVEAGAAVGTPRHPPC